MHNEGFRVPEAPKTVIGDPQVQIALALRKFGEKGMDVTHPTENPKARVDEALMEWTDSELREQFGNYRDSHTGEVVELSPENLDTLLEEIQKGTVH